MCASFNWEKGNIGPFSKLLVYSVVGYDYLGLNHKLITLTQMS